MLDQFILVAHAATQGLTNPIGYNTLGDLFVGIAKYAVAFSASVATLMILYGAWKLLTSAGEAHEVTEAKNAILYAIIGFIVVLFSAGLVSLVVNILGADRASTPSSFQGTTGNINNSPAPRFGGNAVPIAP